MNKTVCIYPKDESTDFLSPLYDFLCEKGCEGLHKDTTENTDEAYALIKEADSIIFLGHGASDTLYGSPQDGEFTVLINETNIQELLYGKRCFILACNSYEFCENYNLTSFIGFGNSEINIYQHFRYDLWLLFTMQITIDFSVWNSLLIIYSRNCWAG